MSARLFQADSQSYVSEAKIEPTFQILRLIGFDSVKQIKTADHHEAAGLNSTVGLAHHFFSFVY